MCHATDELCCSGDASETSDESRPSGKKNECDSVWMVLRSEVMPVDAKFEVSGKVSE